MKTKNLILFILLSGLFLGTFQTVLAEATPEPPENEPKIISGQLPSDDEVNRVAGQMYCPVCENIPLDACGTQACEQWRELIREKLAQGWDDEQIKEYFVLHYGDRVLAEPPRRGLNLLVYIVPPVLILAAAAVFVMNMRKKSAPETSSPDKEENFSDTGDTYLSRMEEELRKRELD